MIDKVEAKIAELKKQQREEYYRKKEADLTQWGLSPRKKGKKSAPVVVTDEEYEALIDASSGVGMPTRNGFARVLNIAALVVAVAGMEGALPSVVSGLVSAPVVAVPTSVGYGAGAGGVAAALAMLNSCAEGGSVVNIDNGFGAAVVACRMLRRLKA